MRGSGRIFPSPASPCVRSISWARCALTLSSTSTAPAMRTATSLILYNDAPAPMPFFQTLYDYYTDSPDLSPVGALPTPAGFGPNTRTIMQVRITGTQTSGPRLRRHGNARFRRLCYRGLESADYQRYTWRRLYKSSNGAAEGICSDPGEAHRAAAGV